MTFNGTSGVRLAALSFACHGKTRAELDEFVQSCVRVSRRQISQQLRKLCITEAEGRLRLPDNVRPLWRKIYAVAPQCSQTAQRTIR
jgi:hypothetical protein